MSYIAHSIPLPHTRTRSQRPTNLTLTRRLMAESVRDGPLPGVSLTHPGFELVNKS